MNGQIELSEERKKQLDAPDRVEGVVHRMGDDGLHSGQHQGVRSVDEIGMVALGRRLQAQLSVGGHCVVHEHDGVGQFTVVQHSTVVLRQVHLRLVLEPELALVTRTYHRVTN